MKQTSRVSAYLVFILLFCTVGAPSMAQAPAFYALDEGGIAVRVLESTLAGVHIEISVTDEALEALRVAAVTSDSALGGDVSFLSEAGFPRLPFKSTLLGIPPDSVVGLQILGLEERVLPGTYWVEPASRRKAHYLSPDAEVERIMQQAGVPQMTAEQVPDVEIYGLDVAFPPGPAHLGETASVRHQHIVPLTFYPLRFNPVRRELIATVRVELFVEFSYPDGTGSGDGRVFAEAVVEPQAFEQLLEENVLNYDTARHWRRLESPEPLVTRAALSPGDTYRIPIVQDGVYRLTYAALEAAGLPVTLLDPTSFQLFNGGVELDILVAGEADGSFDVADYILFYGRGLTSKYTTTNVYLLTHSQSNGRRMGLRSVTPTGTATVPSTFSNTKRLDGGYWYVTGAPGDDELDRWMWGRLLPPSYPSVQRSFTLSNISTSGNATLQAPLLGQLDFDQSPDHHAQLFLNGTMMADVLWDGMTWYNITAIFPQSLLREGTNTIEVRAPNDLGTGIDFFFHDWFEIVYRDTFVAESDTLTFPGVGPGTWEYRIHGFTSNQLAAFDVSDPAAVKQLVGGVVDPDGGGYRLRIEDLSAAESRYIAVAQSSWMEPSEIVFVSPGGLRAPENGADYLVITHPAFVSHVQSLVDYRAMQGLRTQVVTIDQILNEFNDGILHPRAIHDFLDYAYHNWQPPAPAHVLIAGDGHADFRGYRVPTKPNLVPPYLGFLDPWLGEVPSDNRYVTVSGTDSFPDMMIGRLPFNDTSQATTMVAKILNYEASGAAPWHSNLLFVSDNPDDGGNFYALSDSVIQNNVDPGYVPQRVYLGDTCPYENPATTCRNEVTSSINSGRLFVNYIGHAAETRWAAEQLLNSTAISQLGNEQSLPIVLSMDCLDGLFAWPFLTVLAEQFLQVNARGAVATWAPSGFGLATGHDYLNHGFLHAVLHDGVRDLGSATLAGKLTLWSTGTNLDLIDTYHLFGDPALRINALDADVSVHKAAAVPPNPMPGDQI
ncbi:MAG: hypothetical protein JXA14_23305, partial [Anaerolineae bacterium]|nr:hypothetical protein [Anaerolineae bacterium]